MKSLGHNELIEGNICISYTVSTMAADGLVTQGARASAAVVSTQLSHNILVLTQEGLDIINTLRLEEQSSRKSSDMWDISNAYAQMSDERFHKFE